MQQYSGLDIIINVLSLSLFSLCVFTLTAAGHEIAVAARRCVLEIGSRSRKRRATHVLRACYGRATPRATFGLYEACPIQTLPNAEGMTFWEAPFFINMKLNFYRSESVWKAFVWRMLRKSRNVARA